MIGSSKLVCPGSEKNPGEGKKLRFLGASVVASSDIISLVDF